MKKHRFDESHNGQNAHGVQRSISSALKVLFWLMVQFEAFVGSSVF